MADAHDGIQSTTNDVVISGISGRFPESASIDEFKHNLFCGIDMVTKNAARWPPGLYELPTDLGRLNDLSHFDATFFGVHGKQAHNLNPQLRLLLATTYEAIVDAGYNPVELSGSKTGVFIAGKQHEDATPSTNKENVDGRYRILSGFLSMFANRISFVFNLNGPSMAVDSGNSSSLVALNEAFKSIRAGECEFAIVGATNICVDPVTSLELKRRCLLSSKCKVFDDSADGYARAEAVSVIFIQKSKDARRVYAKIVGAATNNDGYKPQDISHTSAQKQSEFIRGLYEEVGVDTSRVMYVEAGSTASRIGDAEELNAIVDVFCAKRVEPLLVGSVLSNMGHAEVASGLCMLVKVLVAFESGAIPENLHFVCPNLNATGLVDRRLKVVTKHEPLKSGLVALNSMGYGGTNAHVILQPHNKPKSAPQAHNFPRLIAVSGRTQHAVKSFLDKIAVHKRDAEFLQLIRSIHTKRIVGHQHRGFRLLDDNSSACEMSVLDDEKTRPIWFAYSGFGSVWPKCAGTLMHIPAFNETVSNIKDVLTVYGIDLLSLLTTGNEDDLVEPANYLIVLVAMQIALTDVLKKLGLHPDGVVGHSLGELGCAYADEGLTSEQLLVCAYHIGNALSKSVPATSRMATLELPIDEWEKRRPLEIYTACHNSDDSVTVSGRADLVEDLVKELNAQGVFASVVKGLQWGFHCKLMEPIRSVLSEVLQRVVPFPKPRTRLWQSSSVVQLDDPLGRLCSADYIINNLLSPVLFKDALQHVPRNAIVIELAPHAILQAYVKNLLGPACYSCSLIKRDYCDTLGFFLSNLGRLFNTGAQPNIPSLYDREVEYPVGSGTPSIASMIEWDHSVEWDVDKFTERNRSFGDYTFEVDLANEEDKFLEGHCVNGRILYPATGYLTMTWKAFAAFRNDNYQKLPVIFEDIRFERVTTIPSRGVIKFSVNIFGGSGAFQICEGGSKVACGKIRAALPNERLLEQEPDATPYDQQDLLPLTPVDIYKEFRLRGYEYEGEFRSITACDNLKIFGKVTWRGEWISYLDGVLQFDIFGDETCDGALPIRLKRVHVDPILLEGRAENECVQISVCRSKNTGTVKCGGVEMCGVVTTQTQRRLALESNPSLEAYKFVPLQHLIEVDDPLEAERQAFVIVAQLVAENIVSTKLNVVEIPSDRCLAPDLKEAFETVPTIIADILVINPNDSEVALLESFGIEVSHDSRVALDHIHLVVISDSFPRLHQLQSDFVLFVGDTADILGYMEVSTLTTKLGKSYVLARKVGKSTSDSLALNVSLTDFEWVESLKSNARDRPVYLVTQGECSGIVGFLNCLKKERVSMISVRGFLIQSKHAEPFDTSSPFYSSQIRKNLLQNVLDANETWGTYRFLPLNLRNHPVEHAYMEPTIRGDLTSFKWIEWCPPKFSADEYEVCSVHYTGLNFREVMIATGKLAAIPSVQRSATLQPADGMEFSGRDSKGRRVMGIFGSATLATTCMVKPDSLWEVPEKWSLEEAATIPIVYLTSYYALIVRGRISPRESVLIHAGAGGIGIAAITIALKMGCDVYTTVGSEAKRIFLRKRFPQLDDHIGNSRDTSFEQFVMSHTSGRGVDLVLNSLAGRQLEASLRCLAKNGRFLEIGKVDMEGNSSIDPYLLNEATFHGIFLDILLSGNTPDKRKTIDLFSEGIKNGTVEPLPARVFDVKEVELAYRHLASGTHIGKIVIKILNCGQIMAIPRIYMDREKVYVLIGGLGGFGLELANWLVVRGVTKLVLTSRGGIRTGYQSLCVRRLRERSVTVIVLKVDASNAKGAESLLDIARKLGRLGGIFNLAVVLRDNAFETLRQSDFEAVAAPKVDTTRNLDAGTRNDLQLDHFVVFSSVASGRGNAGQTAYGNANSAMERIVEARRALGLPALVIQWGAIGDVGMVIDTLGKTNSFEIAGTRPQRIWSCLATLDTLLRQTNAIVSSYVRAQTKKMVQDKTSLVDVVLNILGFNDIKTVSKTAALSDLGLDSIMSSEIKQTLEINFGILLNPYEIRTLTFTRLAELSRDDTNKQMNDQKSFGDLMPKDLVVSLFDGKQPNVFMVHTIEGHVRTLEYLARLVGTSVIGLQFTINCPTGSIEDLASYYLNHVRYIQGDGPYTIVGYSYGACIAFEMALQLERAGESVSLLLIDGSPLPIFSTVINEENGLSLFAALVADIDQVKLKIHLGGLSSLEERVAHVTQLLAKSISCSIDDIKAAAECFYYRVRMRLAYKPLAKFKGRIALAKAKHYSTTPIDVLGLHSICQQTIGIEILEANHQTIVEGECAQRIASIIRKMLD